jgi:hypothetical protein
LLKELLLVGQDDPQNRLRLFREVGIKELIPCGLRISELAALPPLGKVGGLAKRLLVGAGTEGCEPASLL